MKHPTYTTSGNTQINKFNALKKWKGYLILKKYKEKKNKGPAEGDETGGTKDVDEARCTFRRGRAVQNV